MMRLDLKFRRDEESGNGWRNIHSNGRRREDRAR
jgi:hypothetical protein